MTGDRYFKQSTRRLTTNQPVAMARAAEARPCDCAVMRPRPPGPWSVPCEKRGSSIDGCDEMRHPSGRQQRTLQMRTPRRIRNERRVICRRGRLVPGRGMGYPCVWAPGCMSVRVPAHRPRRRNKPNPLLTGNDTLRVRPDVMPGNMAIVRVMVVSPPPPPCERGGPAKRKKPPLGPDEVSPSPSYPPEVVVWRSHQWLSEHPRDITAWERAIRSV